MFEKICLSFESTRNSLQQFSCVKREIGITIRSYVLPFIRFPWHRYFANVVDAQVTRRTCTYPSSRQSSRLFESYPRNYRHNHASWPGSIDRWHRLGEVIVSTLSVSVRSDRSAEHRQVCPPLHSEQTFSIHRSLGFFASVRSMHHDTYSR